MPGFEHSLQGRVSQLSEGACSLPEKPSWTTTYPVWLCCWEGEITHQQETWHFCYTVCFCLTNLELHRCTEKHFVDPLLMPYRPLVAEDPGLLSAAPEHEVRHFPLLFLIIQVQNCKFLRAYLLSSHTLENFSSKNLLTCFQHVKSLVLPQKICIS